MYEDYPGSVCADRGGIAAGRDVRYYEVREVYVTPATCPVCELRLLRRGMDVCAHCAEREAEQQRAQSVVRFVGLVFACAILLLPLVAFDAPVWTWSLVVSTGMMIAWYQWGMPLLARLRAISPWPTP